MRIIPLAGEAEPMLSPDLVWDGIMGDLALAEPSEVQNRGGLRARAQLETAVLICLMSDARAAAEELRDGDTNRGWPGDTFDLDTAAGEAPIGSRLWLLERSTVDAVETPRRAEDYARAALQPLLDQGAAAAVTARAEADPARNRLTLAVTLTDRAGGLLVSRRFSLLWERLAGISVPYAPVAPEEDSLEPLPPVAPPLFGASLPAGVLLGDEPDGFALDFARNSGLIRSSSDKSLQKSGTIADLCTFTRATAATYFDRNGILRTAGPNVLRLTHDPVTGKSLGYLAEPSRTNIHPQSRLATGWVSANASATVTPNAALDVWGEQCAATFVCADTSSASRRLYYGSNIAVTPGTAYTFSAIIRAVGGQRYVWVVGTNGTAYGDGAATMLLDIVSGTIISTTVGSNHQILPMSDGRWLVSMTGSYTTSTTSRLHFNLMRSAADSIASVVAGVVGDGVEVSDVQIEAGPAVTSRHGCGDAGAGRSIDTARQAALRPRRRHADLCGPLDEPRQYELGITVPDQSQRRQLDRLFAAIGKPDYAVLLRYQRRRLCL